MRTHKKRAAFLTLLTSAILIFTLVPFHVSESYGTSVGDAETPERYEEDYVQHNCLDISSWNGDLDKEDWKAIKDAGVDSVIIRAGYSKLNTGRLKTDDCFEQNIKRATKYGLDVGVYYFTTGLTEKEMTREAEYFMEIIEPYRDKITLPVALDFETNSSGRLNWRTVRELGMENCTNLCCVFCDIIAESGYEPMLYASRGLFNTYLDADELEDKYTIWLAQYTSDLSATGYEGEYYMWQYSSNVRIPGIGCRFDGNYLYEKDYTVINEPREIKAKDEEETVTYKLSDGVESVLPVNSNKDKAKARVTDSYGIVHNYKIIKAKNTDYSTDECIMACLLGGVVDSGKNAAFDPADVRLTLTGDENEEADLSSLKEFSSALEHFNVANDRKSNGDDVYVNIKGNLANGQPVIISIDADSGAWKGESQNLLLIGMDDDGRAIVADAKDRKWFESDQRLKLTDIDELINYIDEGYILIR